MIISKTVRSYAFFVATIIGFIAALVTLGIFISLIALAIATSLFVLLFWKQRLFDRSTNKLRKNLEEIFGTSTGGHIKIVEDLPKMMQPRSEYTNKGLGFKKLTFKAEISKSGRYAGEYRAWGINLDPRPCRTMKILLGSAATWLMKQPIKARDVRQERELSVSPFEHLSPELVGFDIIFPHPLTTGQDFDISWSFRIPSACDIEHDVDIFLMWPYKGRSIDRVDLDITIKSAVRDIRLYVIDNKFNISVWSDTISEDSEFAKNEYQYTTTINRPDRYHALILVFNCNT